MRVKILATVNCLGFKPGQQAEVDLDDKVKALVRAGLLQLMRPTDGTQLSE